MRVAVIGSNLSAAMSVYVAARLKHDVVWYASFNKRHILPVLIDTSGAICVTHYVNSALKLDYQTLAIALNMQRRSHELFSKIGVDTHELIGHICFSNVSKKHETQWMKLLDWCKIKYVKRDILDNCLKPASYMGLTIKTVIECFDLNAIVDILASKDNVKLLDHRVIEIEHKLNHGKNIYRVQTPLSRLRFDKVITCDDTTLAHSYTTSIDNINTSCTLVYDKKHSNCFIANDNHVSLTAKQRNINDYCNDREYINYITGLLDEQSRKTLRSINLNQLHKMTLSHLSSIETDIMGITSTCAVKLNKHGVLHVRSSSVASFVELLRQVYNYIESSSDERS